MKDLFAGLDADDAVEVTDHHGKGVGAEGGAEDVVGVIDGGDPVAHRFVDGFFKRGLARSDGDNFCAHESHAGDVEGLAFHIDCAHVDGAVHAEAGANGGGGDAVLAGSGFGDDAFFAKAFGEEDLADGVVVGSAIVNTIKDNLGNRDAILENMGALVTDLVAGTKVGVKR